jgi:uncharacterized protein YhhL (DUF1145 family)
MIKLLLTENKIVFFSTTLEMGKSPLDPTIQVFIFGVLDLARVRVNSENIPIAVLDK